MVKLSPTLFTRLYASIAFAILVSVVLTQLFVSSLFKQDDLNDFVRDTHYIYTGLIEQTTPNTHPEHSLAKAEFLFAYEFDIEWRNADSKIPLCEPCEYLGDVEGVQVYQLESDRLLAVYWVEQLNAYLLISDLLDPFMMEGDDTSTLDFGSLIEFSIEVDIEVLVFYLSAIISLLLIGGVIYWPIRQLQKQIMSLVEVNHTFGDGDLTVRAEQQLTKPLNQLASSFNMMAASIEGSVKENQIFSQAVPHEVRTPLSRIQLAVGLLRRSCEDDKEVALLENIDTYIDDIDELIGQIVAFTRLNTLGSDDFDVYQTIHLLLFIESRVIAVNQIDEASEITLKFTIDSKLSITTNPMYLRLLIDNLLKNALMHAKSSVVISVNLINNNIVLSVEDDGVGIAEKYFDTVFVPFARLDKSRSRKTGGLGLGLAIAKAATKKMNGELCVTASQLGGAKFTCTFFNKY